MIRLDIKRGAISNWSGASKFNLSGNFERLWRVFCSYSVLSDEYIHPFRSQIGLILLVDFEVNRCREGTVSRRSVSCRPRRRHLALLPASPAQSRPVFRTSQAFSKCLIGFEGDVEVLKVFQSDSRRIHHILPHPSC